MEKYRSKVFNLVLYSEDVTHYCAIEKIKKSYDYAMICHDRDINHETGEVKKTHYHVVLKFTNAKWNTALAEELGITANYIEESHNYKRSLFYLLHWYDEDKAQYLLNEVSGSLRKDLEKFIKNEDKSESDKILEILEEMDNINDIIQVKIFCKYVAKMGYWDVLRRSSGLILRCIDEHNQNYYNNSK